MLFVSAYGFHQMVLALEAGGYIVETPVELVIMGAGMSIDN